MSENVQVWVRVCALNDLDSTKATGFSINGQRLVLTRCGDEPHALDGFCSHMLFPLANAKVNDCVLMCGLHHSTFNTQDGTVIEWSTFPPLVGAALAAVRQRKNLRAYETRITDGDVYILWNATDPAEVRVKI